MWQAEIKAAKVGWNTLQSKELLCFGTVIPQNTERFTVHEIHFIKLSISEAYIAFAFYLQQAQFLKWNQVLLIKLVPGMAQ